ncbi:MAG: flippase-like domain-containing protein [Fibrobacteres bacterium]|nr:flippase-like domain-containing protein [Fibrobacterota bacterium]
MSLKLIVGLIIKLGLTALLVWFLLGNKDLTFENMKNAVNSADVRLLAAASVVSIIVALLQIIRWYEHLKTAGLNYRFRAAAGSWFAGNLLGFISPGRVAELGRGFFLDRTKVKECAKATLAERAFFIEAVFVISIAAFVVASSRLITAYGGANFFYLFLLMVVLAVVGWIIITNGHKIKAISRFALFDAFPRNAENRFYLANLSLILCALMAVQIFLLFRSFYPVSLTSSFVTAELTMAALIFFPVTIGNLGVREGAFVLLMSRLEGMPHQFAVSAGLLLFLQNIVIPSIIGAVVILKSRLPGKLA